MKSQKINKVQLLTYPTARQLAALVTLLFSLVIFSACRQQQQAALKIGDQAPEFTITSTTGETIASSRLKGSPVILRFFLPDCKYCRADTAVFNEYYARYHDSGLQILYINTEERPRELDAFIKDLNIAFPVAVDKDKKLAKEYRVKIVPQTIILDPDHKIIGAILGGVSRTELDSMLASYLTRP